MSKLILTVACPEAARPDAIQMRLVHGLTNGQSASELINTFTAQYQDSQDNRYRALSTPVGQAAIDNMLASLQLADLQRPPMDVPDENGNYLINMAAANRAHDMLRGNVWQPASPDPETGEMPPNPVAQIDGTKIVAVVGMKGTDALAAMGLQAIEVDI